MNTELKAIANDMERLKRLDDAAIRYDVMSDALVWTDELPRSRAVRDLWCLRPVLRFRTGLMLGLHLEEFASIWDDATVVFPAWIGFAPSRCSMDERLATLYRKLKEG